MTTSALTAPDSRPWDASSLDPRPARYPVPVPDADSLITTGAHALAAAPDLEASFIRRYREATVSPRDDYLWGWVIHALEVTEVPGVRPDLIGSCRAAKFLSTMLDVVLDDVADTGTHPDVVSDMMDAVFRGGCARDLPEAIRPSAALGRDLVLQIDTIARGFPGYDELRGFLSFDRLQLESAMRYASLINQVPGAANVSENVAYLCHNMNMVVQGTLDLMARDAAAAGELGPVRELLYAGQLMGRIGNAITTWAREIEDGDLSSTVFPVLRERSGLCPERLRDMSESELTALDRAVGAEEELLGQWRRHRARCLEIARRIHGFDARCYVAGLEALLSLHLASRGLK